METAAGVVTAQSCATEARRAVEEFHAAVVQPEMSLVIFFCSADYDLDALAREMGQRFAGVEVIGCTTAGEIGPDGCRDHSLTGASLPASSFAVTSGGIDELQRFDVGRAEALAQELMRRLERVDPNMGIDNTFAVLLIDGMSVREEPVTRALQQLLGPIPLVGGSAGDGVRFGETHVYYDGRFHADAAVVALLTTALPFTTLKIQHFVQTEQRVVVTAADADRRIVTEIDGLPAAAEYARLVGAKAGSLDSMRFAAQPMVVMIGGTNYVRSIQQENPDGSLTFFCAIEEGVVLRAAVGVGLLDSLEAGFADLHDRVGDPQLVLAFDCILRKLEIVERGLVECVGALYRRNNVVGFNSYGEQFRGVHVNQTLTGIAIGKNPS